MSIETHSPMKKSLLFSLSCFLPLLIPVSPLDAQSKIGFRQLSSTTPVVIQRGTTQVLNIRSNFTLDDAYQVFFDKPGIHATFLETKPIKAPRRGRGGTGTPFRFRFEVPKNQPTGVYELRVATKIAVSSATHLLVTDYPVVLESPKENGQQNSAQPVTLPVAIAGTASPGEDVDHYKFHGKKGQQITAQIYAQRVTHSIHGMQSGNAIYLMDPILFLYDQAGKMIAQNDNFIGADSLIAVTLPQDGDYTLEVRDTRYVGNPKYVYCLEITDSPFVHAVFPSAIERGKTTEVDLIGNALGTTRTSNVTIPPDESLGWKKMEISTQRGPSNPVWVFVSDSHQVVSKATNRNFENASPVTFPQGLNGQFLEPRQTHYYSFEAKKGETFCFDVWANRKGLPLDPVLEIYNASEKYLVQSDDGLQTKDPKMYFKVPTDGKYYLAVRDLHGRSGERFLYHIDAKPAGPDFEVHGQYYYSQIAPGTRMIWFVKLKRLNGFRGPVKMEIEGLPKGVSQVPVTIPPTMNDCALILEAAKNAPINASLVRVIGKATVSTNTGKKHLVRYGRVTCELQNQGGGQVPAPIHTQLVGVTRPLDLLTVTAEPNRILLKPGGKAKIKVRIERNPKFSDPVTLATEFKYFKQILGSQLPPGVKLTAGSTGRLGKNVTQGTLILEAAKNATPVKNYPIAVLARVSITFSITTNYASNPIYLTIPQVQKKVKPRSKKSP